MSMACEFLVTTWGEGAQVNAGKIVLKKGKLEAEPKKGWENVLKTILKEKSYKGDKMFDPKKDPEGWLKSLPHQYSGIALRARMVKENG